MLQSGPTHSFVAKFLHIQSSLAVHKFPRPRTGVCELLMPNNIGRHIWGIIFFLEGMNVGTKE